MKRKHSSPTLRPRRGRWKRVMPANRALVKLGRPITCQVDMLRLQKHRQTETRLQTSCQEKALPGEWCGRGKARRTLSGWLAFFLQDTPSESVRGMSGPCTKPEKHHPLQRKWGITTWRSSVSVKSIGYKLTEREMKVLGKNWKELQQLAEKRRQWRQFVDGPCSNLESGA